MFQAIVGDKYGYRPIPTIIESSLFEKMCMVASSVVSEADWNLVKEWFIKDNNTKPVVYVLQPISAMIPDVSDNVRFYCI